MNDILLTVVLDKCGIDVDPLIFLKGDFEDFLAEDASFIIFMILRSELDAKLLNCYTIIIITFDPLIDCHELWALLGETADLNFVEFLFIVLFPVVLEGIRSKKLHATFFTRIGIHLTQMFKNLFIINFFFFIMIDLSWFGL